MNILNEATISFVSNSGNEAFARASAVAFLLSADPTVNDISDIKTALSEAVTNAIIHGYKNAKGKIYINLKLFEDRKLVIKVKDKGCGIADIKKAMEACFTTGSEDRAGMGFTIMQTFSDKLKVRSVQNRGTIVTMEKILCPRP